MYCGISYFNPTYIHIHETANGVTLVDSKGSDMSRPRFRFALARASEVAVSALW